jgi:hypothetical protein
MDALDIVIHILLSAGYKAIDGWLEIIACKMIVKGFCERFVLSKGRKLSCKKGPHTTFFLYPCSCSALLMCRVKRMPF